MMNFVLRSLPVSILLVEDEAHIRTLLAEELRDRGVNVVESASADEAWSYLQAGGLAHIVVSDVAMPGSMNGVELVRLIKRHYPEVKTVLTSGNPGPAYMADLGPFIPKPYRLDDAATLALGTLGLVDTD